MKQQASSNEERVRALAVLAKAEEIRRSEREGRLIRRIAAKVQRRRVRKPKPKRRLKKRVAIISVGGQPVEGVENEYQQIEN